MVYQSSDLSTTATPSHTSSASDPTHKHSSNGSKDENGLSLGAKIAIGVVVPVVVLGVALVGFLFWRKRPGRGSRNRDATIATPPESKSLVTDDRYRDKTYSNQQEVGGIPIHEISGRQLPHELDSGHR